MHPSRAFALALIGMLTLGSMAGCIGGAVPGVLRLGYFPNLTHAQPLFGLSTGLYQEKMGDTKLQVTSFNAGPSAFESLLAGRVDVIYVGPSPTISTLENTGLDVVVIVAGSASGGAMFIVKEDLDLEDNASYANKRFATPQFGNTQDVALKHYLLDRGHEIRSQGGTVDVVNAANADILSQFQLGRIDGAWLPEPWATRLVREGGGRVHVNESDEWPEGQFVTTHLVTTRKFLDQRAPDIRKLLVAHAEATNELQSGDARVLDAVNDGIEEATGKRLAEDTIQAAFPNIIFTVDPFPETLKRQYQMAADLGFASGPPPSDLDRVYELGLLPEAETATAPTPG